MALRIEYSSRIGAHLARTCSYNTSVGEEASIFCDTMAHFGSFDLCCSAALAMNLFALTSNETFQNICTVTSSDQL